MSGINARVQYSGGLPDIGNRGIPLGIGNVVFVDTERGSNDNTGDRMANAVATMAKALTLVETGGTIYVYGDVREECVGDNLKFDVSIIGLSRGTHHADLPASGYRTGAAVWRAPASPTAATPLLKIRGRGWYIANILFDCPVDSAAIYLERNSSSGTSEYDASHATIEDCRFTDGKYAIQNAGGASFVTVRRNKFQRLTESGGAGIICTSTSVAVPLNWVIEDNIFIHNASHILSSMSYSVIRGNVFGRFTATLAIDIDDQPSANQGEYNVITENYLSGTYGSTAYPPGTNNEWAGNENVAARTTADPS